MHAARICPCCSWNCGSTQDGTRNVQPPRLHHSAPVTSRLLADNRVMDGRCRWILAPTAAHGYSDC